MLRKTPNNNAGGKKQDSTRNMFLLDTDENEQFQEFDMAELEADAELNRELRDLGWVDHHDGISSDPPISSPPRLPAPMKVPVKVVEKATSDPREWDKHDMEVLDVVEDDDIQLTESDMNDPALLDMYHALETAGASPQETEPVYEKTASIRDNATTKNAENSSSISAGITNTVGAAGTSQPSLAPSSEQIKARAMQFYREGNTTEAARWLRVSKLMAAGSSFEDASKSLAGSSTAVNTGKPSPVPAPKEQPKNTPTSAVGASSNNKTSNQRGQSNPTSSSTASAASSTNATTFVASRETRFALLESALREAQQQALDEAKRQKGVNDKLAVARMREYKRYEQELAVLESRKGMAHAEPAPFLWRSVVTETAVEHVDIGEDQLCLFVEGVFDMEGALVGQSSRNITLTYDLGIPRDDPVVGEVKGKVDGNTWSCRMNFKRILPIIKRGKSIQQLLVRKKATFEVVLNRGMFFSNISLGTTTLPLVDLLTKCECGGALPLLRPAGDSAGGRKGGMLTAGSVKVLLTLRKPLSQPEVIRTEERVLVLEQWPTVVDPHNNMDSSNYSAAQLHQNKVTTDVSSSSLSTAAVMTNVQGNPPEQHLKATTTTTAKDTAAATSADSGSSGFDQLTAREKADPCAVEFLDSNDVIEAELESTQQALVALAGGPPSPRLLNYAPSNLALVQEVAPLSAPYYFVPADLALVHLILVQGSKHEGCSVPMTSIGT